MSVSGRILQSVLRVMRLSEFVEEDTATECVGYGSSE